MKMRVCTTCKKNLPATPKYFYKHKEHKDGLRNECKECFRARERKRYAKNVAKANQSNMKRCAKTQRAKHAIDAEQRNLQRWNIITKAIKPKMGCAELVKNAC